MVTPTSRSTRSAKRARTAAGGAPCSACGAGQVQHGLVDRQRLHERRQVLHQGADVPGGGGVFRHVGADDLGIRAGLQRLPHRHGAADAMHAGDVAGRRDDAAHAAADDDGAAGQLRPVALLHAGEEGVAVHVGNGEGEQLGMAHDPAGAAGGAGWAGRRRTAIAAEAGTTRQLGRMRHREEHSDAAIQGPQTRPRAGGPSIATPQAAPCQASTGGRGYGLAGHSQAAPRTPLLSPCMFCTTGVSDTSLNT